MTPTLCYDPQVEHHDALNCSLSAVSAGYRSVAGEMRIRTIRYSN